MEHPGFFEKAAPLRLDALAEKVGAQLGAGADPGLLIHDANTCCDSIDPTFRAGTARRLRGPVAHGIRPTGAHG